MKSQRREHGFTLIEVLIVVSIIAVLASMITTGLIYARSRAASAKTQSQIGQISNALKRFYSDEGFYPGSNVDPDDNAFPTVFDALLGERRPRGPGGRNAPYLDGVKEADLVTYDEDTETYRAITPDERYDKEVKKYLIDGYAMPFFYRENRTKDPDDVEGMHNRYTFDLWSNGVNTVNDTLDGNEENDDIGNW